MSVSFEPSAESDASPPMVCFHCSLYGMIFILGWRKYKIVETFLLALGVSGAEDGVGHATREEPSSALRAPSPIPSGREKGIGVRVPFSRPKDGRRWPTGRMRAVGESL